MLKKFLAVLLSCLVFSPAFATLTFRLAESGGNVVVTVSGSLNTVGLTTIGPFGCGANGLIQPRFATICVGAGATLKSGLAGPTTFGSNITTNASSSTGDSMFFDGTNGNVGLPAVYTSGSPLSGTATFNGKTFATLGVTPGTYTWTKGAGADADTVVVTTVPEAVATVATVPTLSEWGMMLLAGLMALATFVTLRRRMV